jgi:hypothetical protein
MTDEDRINFLSLWAIRSVTGVTISWTLMEGYKITILNETDEGQKTLREALDVAIDFRR